MFAYPAIPLEDQVRGYWIAASFFRRSTIPPEVTDALAERGEITREDVRGHATATLCAIGTIATSERLRRRVMRDWPSFVPVQPPMPPLGAA